MPTSRLLVRKVVWVRKIWSGSGIGNLLNLRARVALNNPQEHARERLLGA